jgi:APA family basic amino acid/polyamine antiporter
MPSQSPQLARELGVGAATAIVVGTIIGSGIFLVPAEMTQAVGSAKLVYLAWIIGGILSFAGALTYAELGAMKPQSGGEYVYVRDAYGPLWGFLYGWTWFLIAKPASIATITTGIVRILGSFSAFAFFNSEFIHAPVSLTYGQLVAIAAAIVISVLNYLGVKKAGDFQLIFTILKIVIIIGIVIVCFTAPKGTWSNFAGEFLGAKGGFEGFFLALVAALWAYDGWNDLNMVAEEIRQPERNIPIALIAGVGIVGALYILLNAAVQYVLPVDAVAASPRAASDAVAAVIGPYGANIVSLAMAFSMLVTLNGTIMSGARVPFAVARDGYFFRALAEVHPRFHTPSVAIVVQCALAILLLALGGSFRQFFSLAIFAEWLFYMIASSTIFVFRKRDPDARRPYRVWGYPVVPGLFVAVAAVLLVRLLFSSLRDDYQKTSLAILTILAGVPVFYYFSRKRKDASPI